MSFFRIFSRPTPEDETVRETRIQTKMGRVYASLKSVASLANVALPAEVADHTVATRIVDLVRLLKKQNRAAPKLFKKAAKTLEEPLGEKDIDRIQKDVDDLLELEEERPCLKVSLPIAHLLESRATSAVGEKGDIVLLFMEDDVEQRRFISSEGLASRLNMSEKELKRQLEQGGSERLLSLIKINLKDTPFPQGRPCLTVSPEDYSFLKAIIQDLPATQATNLMDEDILALKENVDNFPEMRYIRLSHLAHELGMSLADVKKALGTAHPTEVFARKIEERKFPQGRPLVNISNDTFNFLRDVIVSRPEQQDLALRAQMPLKGYVSWERLGSKLQVTPDELKALHQNNALSAFIDKRARGLRFYKLTPEERKAAFLQRYVGKFRSNLRLPNDMVHIRRAAEIAASILYENGDFVLKNFNSLPAMKIDKERGIIVTHGGTRYAVSLKGKSLEPKILRISNLLGKGGWGDVVQAEKIYKPSSEVPVPQDYALKRLFEEDPELLENSFQVMKTLGSFPGILPPARLFMDCSTGKMALWMPFYPMNGRQALNEQILLNDRMHMFGQCVQGLNHFHKNGIVHGDIKPENMLVNVKKSKMVLSDYDNVLDTKTFISPEQAGSLSRLDTMTEKEMALLFSRLRNRLTDIEDKVLSKSEHVLHGLVTPYFEHDTVREAQESKDYYYTAWIALSLSDVEFQKLEPKQKIGRLRKALEGLTQWKRHREGRDVYPLAISMIEAILGEGVNPSVYIYEQTAAERKAKIAPTVYHYDDSEALLSRITGERKRYDANTYKLSTVVENPMPPNTRKKFFMELERKMAQKGVHAPEVVEMLRRMTERDSLQRPTMEEVEAVFKARGWWVDPNTI